MITGLEEQQAPVEVLLVEDNAGDARLAAETLRDSPTKVRLHVVRNGEEALAFLRREPPHQGVPRVQLILLDLNLPGKDGRAVLAEIKADPKLAIIPVVILTSSNAEQDVLRAYNLRVNCYVTKPLDLEQFTSIVRSVEDFWLATVRLPGEA